MIIEYRDGRTVEALILARDSTTMRVAVKGGDDVLQLDHVNGRWVTEDREAVHIEFAWDRAIRHRACMRGRSHLLKYTTIELDSYLAIQYAEQEVIKLN